MSKFRILSIDGGGIRGLIPATILVHIEKEIQRKQGSNKKIGDFFEFIAGTSTGGILTCLYLTPEHEKNVAHFSAEDARNLYLEHGDEIFSRSFGQKLSSLGGFGDEKYDSETLEDVLTRYFKDLSLNKLIRPCLIPGFDVRQYKPIFYTQQDAHQKDRNYLIRDVARATSAAPTYFEAARPENLDNIPNAHPVIDGGVFANNPTVCAFVEALKKGRKSGVPVEEVVVLSLGTGSKPKTITFKECKDWGLAGWARPLIGILMEGVGQAVDYQMKSVFESLNKTQDYLRIDGQFGDYQNSLDIPGLKTDLDCATQDNMSRLCQFGDQLFQNNETEIKEFVKNHF